MGSSLSYVALQSRQGKTIALQGVELLIGVEFGIIPWLNVIRDVALKKARDYSRLSTSTERSPAIEEDRSCWAKMSRLVDMLRNLVGASPDAADRPRSANGASSFHLSWQMPAKLGPEPRLTEVSAVLEVLVPPRVKALYFWALQVDLVDGRGAWGVGHTGLQWNKRYPGGTAVNWGGYASAEQGGVVLPGTQSPLSGFSDDPNTLAYSWQPERPYRIRVYRSPETPEGWRVEVTDLVAGLSNVVRDLLPVPGRQTTGSCLSRPLVWSEVFADCDAPSVTVRWSDLAARDEAGNVLRPEAVRVSYQAYDAGGCPNTTVGADETGGVFQVTNTPRLVEHGAVLAIARPGVSVPAPSDERRSP